MQIEIIRDTVQGLGQLEEDVLGYGCIHGRMRIRSAVAFPGFEKFSFRKEAVAPVNILVGPVQIFLDNFLHPGNGFAVHNFFTHQLICVLPVAARGVP